MPTFAESGYPQELLQLTGPYAVFLPAKTPRELVDRLGREFAAVVKLPEIRKRLEDGGLEPVGNNAAEAQAAYKARLPVILKAVRDTGVTLD